MDVIMAVIMHVVAKNILLSVLGCVSDSYDL